MPRCHRVPVVRVSDIEMSPRPIRCYRFVVEFALSPSQLWDSRVSCHYLFFPGHCCRVFAEPSRCSSQRYRDVTEADSLLSSSRCHRVTCAITESLVTACCSRVTAVEFSSSLSHRKHSPLSPSSRCSSQRYRDVTEADSLLSICPRVPVVTESTLG